VIAFALFVETEKPAPFFIVFKVWQLLNNAYFCIAMCHIPELTILLTRATGFAGIRQDVFSHSITLFIWPTFAPFES